MTLATVFAPVFERIAKGAVERESDRTLPSEQVEWLRESGFGKIRVPREFGGFGATVPEFIELLIELGRADSNLPQLLRGHFGFVESRLALPDPQARERWLRRVAAGVIVGNAQSERSSSSWFEPATTLTAHGDGWRLDGRKFYSTGSLFADWIHTSASRGADGIANVLVPASAPGVTRIDDWDGFGQRLTGSGTTLFEDVPIAAEDVEPAPDASLAAFFQLVHLATLAGIGRAAVAETVAFVNGRARNLFNPAVPPSADPQVQAVVGRVAGASFAADAATMAAARAVEAAAEHPDAADIAVFRAQGVVIRLVLDLVTELFEVGGASATAERLRLDRHWRNARTLASHNPVIYRDRAVGQFLLDGTTPSAAFQQHRKGTA
ncbi:acyl-CoA dehydrogenase family protein [Dactylosporangium vinaceum]|uniref:Dibenzothiophene monooxygenase n=1 Tax=Dactylosporangium vinaceum TaxID=53362 RepID=A0ABV5M9L6_9ACTN|nr:acyl-CoA dehydrogenase family protein [Dactylosporangium vinaceum]UAC00038.1 acyl-CoA dehydrogenase family protein [Dactylosporangium vinaceum]